MIYIYIYVCVCVCVCVCYVLSSYVMLNVIVMHNTCYIVIYIYIYISLYVIVGNGIPKDNFGAKSPCFGSNFVIKL